MASKRTLVYYISMNNNTEKTLKILLISAVVLNMLLLVLQVYNTRTTIKNARQSLIMAGQATLSTFEGGRRAMLALNPEFSGRFKSFIQTAESNTAVRSIYIFRENGEELINTGDIKPPFNNNFKANDILDTEDGLFIYRKLKPRPMAGMGRGMMEHFDDVKTEQLIGAVLLDTAGLKQVQRSERSFLIGVFVLQMLLMFVFYHVIRLIRSSQERARLMELQEREAQMGKMSLVMAHELKNPLSSVKGLLEFSAKKAEGQQKEIAERSVAELARLDRIINDFLTYGRDMTPEKRPTDMLALALDTAKLLEIDAHTKGLVINITGEHTDTEADGAKMKQVLFNLLLNAVQASPENAEIKVSVNRSGMRIVNDIKDMSFDKEKLGTPFYTTKTVGTGLGIAIVKRILHLHGFGLKITADKTFTTEITF